MSIDNQHPPGQPSENRQKGAIMDVLNGQAATALYRTSSFLLLGLISVCAFIATNALDDIKDLTKEVRRLNDRLAEIVGNHRVTDATVKSLDSRVGQLEIRMGMRDTSGRPLNIPAP